MINSKKGFGAVVLTIIVLVLAILVFINFAPTLSNTAATGIAGTSDGLTKFSLAALPIMMLLVMIWIVLVRGDIA